MRNLILNQKGKNNEKPCPILQPVIMSNIYAEKIPKGSILLPNPGDIIFVKGTTITDWIIRIGEFIRFRKDTWSHVAYHTGNGYLVEAITTGTQHTNIDKYKDVEYLIVRTGDTCLINVSDKYQAERYLETQIGKKYGWLTVFGTATRFLIPGRGFAFIGRTNICSGLVAQALTRGDFTPALQCVTISPSELAEALGVSTT